MSCNITAPARRPKADRLERLRNVEPDTALLLAVLVRATGARALLELGTSNGYSTLWLADATRSIGGHILSVDVDPKRSAQAGLNLDRAGLRDIVELRVEDAAVTLRDASEAEWDMIFLDANVGLPWLLAGPGARTEAGWPSAVDNVLSHAEELGDFRELIRADERVSEALVPTGAGVRRPRTSRDVSPRHLWPAVDTMKRSRESL